MLLLQVLSWELANEFTGLEAKVITTHSAYLIKDICQLLRNYKHLLEVDKFHCDLKLVHLLGECLLLDELLVDVLADDALLADCQDQVIDLLEDLREASDYMLEVTDLFEIKQGLLTITCVLLDVASDVLGVILFNLHLRLLVDHKLMWLDSVLAICLLALK